DLSMPAVLGMLGILVKFLNVHPLSPCASSYNYIGYVVLLPVQEAQAFLRAQMFVDVIVLENTDSSVDLEYGERDVTATVAAMFAESAFQLVLRYMFPGQVIGDRLAVMDQQGRRSLDHAAKAAVHAGNLCEQVIERQEHGSSDRATDQRCVGPS